MELDYPTEGVIAAVTTPFGKDIIEQRSAFLGMDYWSHQRPGLYAYSNMNEKQSWEAKLFPDGRVLVEIRHRMGYSADNLLFSNTADFYAWHKAYLHRRFPGGCPCGCRGR